MAQQCEATAKATGERCARKAIEGGRTCRVHGSGTKAAKAAAARRIEEAAAAAAVVTLGARRDVSPTDALLEEVQWTAGHVAWLRERVRELEDDALVWGTTRVETEAGGAMRIDIEDGDVAGIGSAPSNKVVQTAAPSVWYDLYERERRHLLAACTAALKAGVEERRVRLAEQQGDLVAGVLRAILDGLLSAMLAAGMADTLRDVWAEHVQVIVPRELRRLAAGGAS